MKDKIYFTHMINGTSRKLFSASLAKDGSVVLGLKSAGTLRHIPELDQANRRSLGSEAQDHSPVDDQHYSIHPSKSSKFCLTTIKFTVGLQNSLNKPETYGSYYGLGEGNLAPVFSHLVSDRSSDRFQLKEKEERSSELIGSYDPREQTLLFSVYVTKREPKKNELESTYFSTKIHKVGEFYLVICASVCGWPARDQANLLHFGNVNKDIVEPGAQMIEAKTGTISCTQLEKNILLGYIENIGGYLSLISSIDGTDYRCLQKIPVSPLPI